MPLLTKDEIVEFEMQKVEYIHRNPVRAALCSTVEEYRWSSAKLMMARHEA